MGLGVMVVDGLVVMVHSKVSSGDGGGGYSNGSGSRW